MAMTATVNKLMGTNPKKVTSRLVESSIDEESDKQE
jgi:hypothetical protein